MNTDSSLSSRKKDSTLIFISSNLSMIQTDTYHHEQCQSINNDLFSTSNNNSLSLNNMISSLTFSKTVTNSMIDNEYPYPWMRLGIYKLFDKNSFLKIHKDNI